MRLSAGSLCSEWAAQLPNLHYVDLAHNELAGALMVIILSVACCQSFVLMMACAHKLLTLDFMPSVLS